jgi:hypothetical protein
VVHAIACHVFASDGVMHRSPSLDPQAGDTGPGCVQQRRSELNDYLRDLGLGVDWTGVLVGAFD